MSKRPFGFIELPADRSTSKPRAKGLTMIIDWGLGLRQLEDILEMSGLSVIHVGDGNHAAHAG